MRCSTSFESMFFSVAPGVDRGCEAPGVDSHSAFFKSLSAALFGRTGAEGQQAECPRDLGGAA
jgi:hypothetical protein